MCTVINQKMPVIFIVPHKSLNLVEEDIQRLFESIRDYKPEHVFIFGELHNGPIGFDDKFTIYTDSNCPVNNNLLTKSDDVCSEEFGAEILLPFCDKYFHGIPVNQFLTPEKNAENANFFNWLKENYSKSVFFISRNEKEDSVWPENLQD